MRPKMPGRVGTCLEKIGTGEVKASIAGSGRGSDEQRPRTHFKKKRGEGREGEEKQQTDRQTDQQDQRLSVR